MTVIPNQGKEPRSSALKQRDACSRPCGLTKRKPKQAARLLAGIHERRDEGAGLGLAQTRLVKPAQIHTG